MVAAATKKSTIPTQRRRDERRRRRRRRRRIRKKLFSKNAAGAFLGVFVQPDLHPKNPIIFTIPGNLR